MVAEHIESQESVIVGERPHLIQIEENPLGKILDQTVILISLCTRCKVITESPILPGIAYTATICDDCLPAERLNLRFHRLLRAALDNI